MKLDRYSDCRMTGLQRMRSYRSLQVAQTRLEQLS